MEKCRFCIVFLNKGRTMRMGEKTIFSQYMSKGHLVTVADGGESTIKDRKGVCFYLDEKGRAHICIISDKIEYGDDVAEYSVIDMENKERVSVCRVVEDLFNYPFEDNSMEENEIAEMTTSLDFLYLQIGKYGELQWKLTSNVEELFALKKENKLKNLLVVAGKLYFLQCQPEMEIVKNKAIFTINVKNEELVRIDKTINPDNFRENSVPN